ACLACFAALTAAPAARAQQQPTTQVFKVEKIRVGFQGSAQEDPAGTFKPGLWAPVHVTLLASPDGNIPLSVRVDGSVEGEVRVETNDSDGLPNVYPEAFRAHLPKGQRRLHLMAYTRPAAREPGIKVSVHGARGDHAPQGRPEHLDGLQVHEHLYLTAGARLPDLYKALLAQSLAVAPRPDDKQTAPYHLAHETEVHRLPRRWFGYDGVDLL